MGLSAMHQINNLIDERKCYEEVRRIRWLNEVCYPGCTSNKINKRGRNHQQQVCRRHTYKNCGKRFADRTGTPFMGRYQPLSVWFAYLYLMGLNLSNRQIAEELNLNESDGQAMADELRSGIVKCRSKVPKGRNQSSAQAWESTGYQGQKNAKFRGAK